MTTVIPPEGWAQLYHGDDPAAPELWASLTCKKQRLQRKKIANALATPPLVWQEQYPIEQWDEMSTADKIPILLNLGNGSSPRKRKRGQEGLRKNNLTRKVYTLLLKAEELNRELAELYAGTDIHEFISVLHVSQAADHYSIGGARTGGRSAKRQKTDLTIVGPSREASNAYFALAEQATSDQPEVISALEETHNVIELFTCGSAKQFVEDKRAGRKRKTTDPLLGEEGEDHDSEEEEA